MAITMEDTRHPDISKVRQFHISRIYFERYKKNALYIGMKSLFMVVRHKYANGEAMSKVSSRVFFSRG